MKNAAAKCGFGEDLAATVPALVGGKASASKLS
jgi:hypothetical protein